MYVRNHMTPNPYTLDPDSTIADALDLMRTKKIRRLPVVKNGKLVGIVTERKLLEVSPSPATSLSIFEINYLLSKTKIDSIMTKNVITISPDSLLEEAAILMRDNDIGALPVVENGKLKGIITETNIFDAFISMLSFREKGTRLTIFIDQDRPGLLEKISGIIAKFNINISNLVFSENELVIKLDSVEAEKAIEQIKNSGFKVISVIKNT